MISLKVSFLTYKIRFQLDDLWNSSSFLVSDTNTLFLKESKGEKKNGRLKEDNWMLTVG